MKFIQLNVFCIMILLQTYNSQGVECGALNIIVSHNLIGRGSVRWCGFVEVGMALLEQMCYCVDGLGGFCCSGTAQFVGQFLVV